MAARCGRSHLDFISFTIKEVTIGVDKCFSVRRNVHVSACQVFQKNVKFRGSKEMLIKAIPYRLYSYCTVFFSCERKLGNIQMENKYYFHVLWLVLIAVPTACSYLKSDSP